LSKNTYRLPFKIGLTAAEEVLPIFSATILDFEMIVEGITYYYLKKTILRFGYAGIVLLPIVGCTSILL
jgi:hypothetical protein